MTDLGAETRYLENHELVERRDPETDTTATDSAPDTGR